MKIPKGWPTEEMQEVGNRIAATYGVTCAVPVFRAMLEKAPTQPEDSLTLLRKEFQYKNHDGHWIFCFESEVEHLAWDHEIRCIHTFASPTSSQQSLGVITPLPPDKRNLAPEVHHYSDCATHNEPAEPNGPCDCGGYIPTPPEVEPVATVEDVGVTLEGKHIFNGVGIVQRGQKLYAYPPSPKAPEVEPVYQVQELSSAPNVWTDHSKKSYEEVRRNGVSTRILFTSSPSPKAEEVSFARALAGLCPVCKKDAGFYGRAAARLSIVNRNLKKENNELKSPKAEWSADGKPLNLAAAARDCYEELSQVINCCPQLDNLRKFLPGESS